MERAYEFQRYDRVWQRVAPALEPYPNGTACGNGTETAGTSGQGGAAPGRRAIPPGADVRTVTGEPVQNQPAAVPQALAAVRTAAAQTDASPAASLAAASLPTASLPGAEQNPCCMGSEAAEDLEVLAGFLEEERGEERALLALCRQAPQRARQALREMASGAAARARRLAAAYYLIAGTRCPAMPEPACGCPSRWREALRERYHSAACMALNYARAADGTPDPCLARLLEDLSGGAFRQASGIMRLLEGSV